MTYNEFCDWCNLRACDGYWSADIAKICCHIIVTMRKVPFWKREKIWRRVYKELEIEEVCVKPTNERMEAYRNER